MNTLWRLHGGALFRFALKLTLGDRQRAEDIVQETMIRAWRHPEIVDGREQLIRAWLFTVTRRVAIDMWRARSRNPEVIEDEPVDWPDPVQHIDQAVTALDVRAAIAKLTPKHQQVVVEMYFYGRQADEIAESSASPLAPSGPAPTTPCATSSASCQLARSTPMICGNGIVWRQPISAQPLLSRERPPDLDFPRRHAAS
jgi:RNA polymerase sigma-70 factor (ECF subfamily)